MKKKKFGKEQKTKIRWETNGHSYRKGRPKFVSWFFVPIFLKSSVDSHMNMNIHKEKEEEKKEKKEKKHAHTHTRLMRSIK